MCYYKAIEYCITHNLSYMEPGAGQDMHAPPLGTTHPALLFINTNNLPGGGEFKYLRGFDPYVVSSVHWFRSPRLQAAVGDFLEEERTHNKVRYC